MFLAVFEDEVVGLGFGDGDLLEHGVSVGVLLGKGQGEGLLVGLGLWGGLWGRDWGCGLTAAFHQLLCGPQRVRDH